MNSLNKVQLIGNLTADPEVRKTPNGQSVASITLATNRTWKDAAGIKQEQAEYHPVVLWGKLAEIVEQYLKKGQKAYVEGRMQTRSWDDPSGTKRYKTEVVAESLIMLSSAGGSRSDSGFDVQEDAPEEAVAQKVKRSSKKDEEDIKIEDIPF